MTFADINNKAGLVWKISLPVHIKQVWKDKGIILFSFHTYIIPSRNLFFKLRLILFYDLSTEVQGVIHKSTGFLHRSGKKLYHGTAGIFSKKENNRL